MAIEEDRERAIREHLRRKHRWRGEAAMRAAMDEYDVVSEAIDTAGDRIDPEWSVRLARAARVVLSARARASAHAMIEDGKARARAAAARRE